jgi:YHS domain-containing protein
MDFAMTFPDIQLTRGARFVEDGNLASSGGLSSGIDLAMRVVRRYFGLERAEATADMTEYQGRGWLDPNSNQAYVKAQVSTDEHPLCPLCSMDADRSLKSVYKAKTYYFCSPPHKEEFDKTPARFAVAS